jgi:ATP-binding cassette subfamily B protein
MTELVSTSLFKDFVKLKKLWPFIRPWRKFVYGSVCIVPIIFITKTSIPLILKYTIDRGVSIGDTAVIAVGSALFLGSVLLEYLCSMSQTLLMSIGVHRMVRDLRNTLIEQVLRLSPSFHDHHLSGALVTRATSDFDNMSESLNQSIINSGLDIVVILGSIFGMLILDWQLTMSVLVVIPFVLFIIITFSRSLKKTMLIARAKIAQLNAYTQECLIGVDTVKLLSAQKAATETVSAKAIEYRNAQMKSVFLDAMMFALLDGIASITMGVFLWFAVSPFAAGATEDLTAGVIIAFVAYIVNLYDPLKHLGNKIAMLQGAFTSIDRIFGILETDDFIGGKRKLKELKGEVEFKHVAFGYRGTKNKADLGKKVLRDVSFKVNQGQSLALVGATGSGKSTVIKLLSKLYEGYSGEILLDGQSISDLDPEDLKRRIAIVPQDINLFEGSVEFNISLGLPGIQRHHVQEAAKLVGADRFIQKLPGSYDFLLTPMGQNLSQGQRQLLAFARALAKNPALVILDEATSSVDPQSESEIQRAVMKILQERTVIIIAHRLTTIEHCDQILVFEDGKIIERGSHKELVDAKGSYARMQAQFV